MTTYIINLSDIIDVQLQNSIIAFAELAKESGVTSYDCCGGLLSKTFGTIPLIKAALLYYNSTINEYKLGKMTTPEFIKTCLNVVFPRPASYENDPKGWDNKLIAAWNKMLKINLTKCSDFFNYVKNHSNDRYILITNSNDAQVTYVIQEIKKQLGLDIKVVPPQGLDLKNNMVQLVSSHTAGKFKTDAMIKDIIAELGGSNDIKVFTKYDDDITYCKGLNIDSTLIGEGFDYNTFSQTPKVKLN
ncbi:MAG: hypothetical protein ACK4PR_01980 [Gammaproteobacteria bacterium]